MLIIADHYKTKSFVSTDRYISVAILNNAFFTLAKPYGELKCAFYILKNFKKKIYIGEKAGWGKEIQRLYFWKRKTTKHCDVGTPPVCTFPKVDEDVNCRSSGVIIL